MSMSTKQMGTITNAVYILSCICSLGTIWLMKIIIQKAIIDALESKIETATNSEAEYARLKSIKG